MIYATTCTFGSRQGVVYVEADTQDAAVAIVEDLAASIQATDWSLGSDVWPAATAENDNMAALIAFFGIQG